MIYYFRVFLLSAFILHGTFFSAIAGDLLIQADPDGYITWTNVNPDLYYTVESRPNLTGDENWDGSYVHLRDIQSSDKMISVPAGLFYRIVGSETQKHTRTLSPSSSELPAGYYEAAQLSDIDGNLSPENIRAGRSIFGVGGILVEATGSAPDSAVLSGLVFSRAGEAGRVGTMPNIGSQHIMPGTSEQTIFQGYHSGTGAVAGDPNLAASNIVSGVTLFNITGTGGLVPFSAQPAVLMNDNFNDGDRTNQDLPDSAHWYYTSTARIWMQEKDPGEYVKVIDSNSSTIRIANAYFAPDNAPASLTPEYNKIRLNFNFTPVSSNAPSDNLGFRAALLNSGTERMTGDATVKYDIYEGYALFINPGTGRVEFTNRRPADDPDYESSYVLQSTVPYNTLDVKEELLGLAMDPGSTYNFTMEVEQLLNGDVMIKALISDGVDTVSVSYVDDTYKFVSFDTVAFGNRSYGATEYDDIKVSLIPDPGLTFETRIEALETISLIEWVRSGSNSRGNWVQFEDGTMICYSTGLGPVDVDNSKGRGYESDNLLWRFPVSFAEPPAVKAGAGNLDVWVSAGGDWWDADQIVLRAHSFSQRSGVSLNAVAVGKWKTGSGTASAPPGNIGQSVQTLNDLYSFGPRASRVVLSSVSWSGTIPRDIFRISPGVIPVGGTFTLVIPRTIGSTGGPAGYGANLLGNYVRIQDKDNDSSGGSSSNIECIANNRLSYYAYPNACDFLGNDAALQEHLVFQRTSSGWALIGLPPPRTGFTHGSPVHVPGTTSLRGFAWERKADGTARVSSGAIRLLSHSSGSGTGDAGPRFHGSFDFPFRFEEHIGSHHNFQAGIVEKTTAVPFSALSVPVISTEASGMEITVYVENHEQSKVTAQHHVTVSISGYGNWKLKGTPGE